MESVPPSTPPIETLPPAPEVVSREIVESEPALQGVRRFITLARLAWTEETRGRLEAGDHIVRSTASETSGARLIRGFKSDAETSDVVPVTKLQRANSLRRQGQVRKIGVAERENWRVNEIYGDKPELPELRREDFPTIDAFRWAEMERKRVKNDAPKGHDLGSEEHTTRLYGSPDARRFGLSRFTSDPAAREPMSRGHRRAEAQATRSHRRTAKTTNKYNERMDRAEAGETVPGRTRSARISRVQRRQQTLEDRLGVGVVRWKAPESSHPISPDTSPTPPEPVNTEWGDWKPLAASEPIAWRAPESSEPEATATTGRPNLRIVRDLSDYESLDPKLIEALNPKRLDALDLRIWREQRDRAHAAKKLAEVENPDFLVKRENGKIDLIDEIWEPMRDGARDELIHEYLEGQFGDTSVPPLFMSLLKEGLRESGERRSKSQKTKRK